MYHGDIRLGDTIDIKFSTVTTTGAPTQLAGTPVISAYPGNSTTQLTAGITLTADFDSVTGLNNVRVVASGGNGYATATNYTLVITTGTVGGTSVVGYCIGSFSIENRSAVMPTTAGRTLDVSATGEAGLDWANIGSPTTANNLSSTNIDVDQVVASVSGAVASVTNTVNANMTQISGDSTAADNLETAFDDTAGAVPWMGIVDQGTAQSASATGVVLRSAAAFADSALVGATIAVFGSTQGYWQQRSITANALSGDAVTVATWDVTPSGTITYKIFGTAPASGGGGGGLDAAGVRAAIGLASANLDTQLGDLPTSAELATALGTADDAVLAAIAALNNLSSAQAQTAATAALNAYDPPTRAELTSDTNSVLTAVGDVPTNAELATALGTADDAVLAAIAALNNLSAAGVRAAVGLASANLDTQLATIDSTADAILDDTGTTGVEIAAGALDAAALSTDAAQEIRDVIVNHTLIELTGDPGATPALDDALMLIYMALRNRRDTTASADEIHNSAGTPILTATVSDDGTTFSKARYA